MAEAISSLRCGSEELGRPWQSRVYQEHQEPRGHDLLMVVIESCSSDRFVITWQLMLDSGLFYRAVASPLSLGLGSFGPIHFILPSYVSHICI
jgi:hypothetical protein